MSISTREPEAITPTLCCAYCGKVASLTVSTFTDSEGDTITVEVCSAECLEAYAARDELEPLWGFPAEPSEKVKEDLRRFREDTGLD